MKLERYLALLNRVLILVVLVQIVMTSCKKKEEPLPSGTNSGLIQATLNGDKIIKFDNALTLGVRTSADKLWLQGFSYVGKTSVYYNIYIYSIEKTNIRQKIIFGKGDDRSEWNGNSSKVDFYSFDDDQLIGKYILDSARENYLQLTEINELKGIVKGTFEVHFKATQIGTGYDLPNEVHLTKGTFEIKGPWQKRDW